MGSFDSCCVGFIFGLILALLLVVGAVFGLCCAVNPELKNATVEMVDKQWNNLKSNFENLSSQESDGQETPAASEKAE